MKATELRWRVSVATLDRVIFPHPKNGTIMLAMERKASLMKTGANHVHTWAQPYGGAVRILDPIPLQALIGEISFDSEKSRLEQDFRILIQPADWQAVKTFCLQHLENENDTVLEASPDRELLEEFDETLNFKLKPDQYTREAAGFVIENEASATANRYASGQPTVRVYRIFEIHIIDPDLSKSMLAASQAYSDLELAALAVNNAESGGKGRANGILVLPLNQVVEHYLALSPHLRFQAGSVENHQLNESVTAILPGVDVPQYQRL